MVTKHDQQPNSIEEHLIMDIDITILGKPAAEYLNYTKSIRKEYKLVPYFIYKKKRREIMINFLEKERLYNTDHYYKLYEAQARTNIANEIKMLK